MNKNNYMKMLTNFLKENIVTVFFAIMCVVAFLASGQNLSFLLSELSSRFFRNSLLVLSLIIPVLAGIGLNFGIVLGAMAAQAALIFVTYWQLQGLTAILVTVLICTPLSIVFGYLLGCLFNKTKGQEMITGMICGYFANGIYQVFFLILCGSVIPMVSEDLILITGVGIKDTVSLNDSVRNSLDRIWSVPMDKCFIVGCVLILLWCAYNVYKANKTKNTNMAVNLRSVCIRNGIVAVLTIALIILSKTNKQFKFALSFTDIPMIPLFITVLACLFMQFIIRTKLGQDFRAIGNNMKVANAAGINVDKTRIMAIIISTVIASWGQVLFLQNLGNFSTYSSHDNVGTFSVAAILVGGASVRKATVGQAILGILLFHTLFIVSPMAGKNLFNDAQYGEYFRTFVSYGVIAVALVLHVISRSREKKAAAE